VIYDRQILNDATAEVKSEDETVTSIGWKNDDGSYHLYNDMHRIEVFDVNGINTVIDDKGRVYHNFKDYGIDTLYSKNNRFDKNAVILLNDVIDISEYYKKLGFNGFDQVDIAINDGYDEGKNARGGSEKVDGIKYAVMLVGKKFDFANKDVVAHEYTHAVTSSVVNWSSNYIENSALNEAYSDIFGTLYENPQTPDWKMVHLSKVIRDLIEPSKTNGYDNMSDIDESDNYNQYTLSTIISHAAYLMWNGSESGIDIFKIDSDKLAKLWYRSLFLLQSDATFNQCANAVILTAESMLDSGALTQAQVACVRRSFESVGIYADMLSNLSKGSTNGAAVKVKDINGNNLFSYYLKVTDKNSNVIVDSEFTESNPYIINVSENGIYKFAVKGKKSSSAEFVINVRILAVNKENSELNLQTSIDTGDSNSADSEEKKGNNTNYGNIIVNNQCLYYWKYNSKSYVDDAVFGKYMYKQGTVNQLICRKADGKEIIILETAGAGEIALVNNRIFYQVPVNDFGKYSISTCKLDGTDIKILGEGTLAAVSEDGYVIYSSGEQINSISQSDLSIKALADDATLKAVKGKQVYFQPRETDEEAALHGRTTLSAVNADGSNRRVLYITNDDLYRSDEDGSDWLRSRAIIWATYVSDEHVFYAYGSIAGSGHVFQGGKIAKVKLDGSGGEILGEAYACENGPMFLVDKDNNIIRDYSCVKSAMNDPYFNNGAVSMYNQERSAYEEYIVKKDYSDFSTDNISVYKLENNNTLQLGFMERIGDKVYFMLHKGIYDKGSSFNKNAGMIEYYTRTESALFEKDLKSGNVILLYNVGKPDELSTNAVKGQFSIDTIPQNAVEHNGHYYYLYKNSEFNSWEDAKSYCESQGGYLATISSEDENDFLFSYIISQNCQSAFFGLNDRETEGEWKWINGESATYTNWSEHEPNSETSLEDEAMFYWKYSDGKWNDGVFRKGDSFICEWGEYS